MTRASTQFDVDILQAAQALWDYLKLDQPLEKCDCIIAMGSHDLRVAEHAAHLALEDWAPFLVCSGGLGRLTSRRWQESEASQFAAIARTAGVPENRILIEDRSSNTGENIHFSKDLLKEKGISVQSALLVHKPYMERRALATAQIAWPQIRYCVSSPPISFKDYPTEEIPLEQVIQIMVGDFQRIVLYPRLGYQTEQMIPPEIKKTFRKLVKAGFTQQMIQL